MFIAEQYDFPWNLEYTDAFLEHESPKGIEGHWVPLRFAHVWDAL